MQEQLKRSDDLIMRLPPGLSGAGLGTQGAKGWQAISRLSDQHGRTCGGLLSIFLWGVGCGSWQASLPWKCCRALVPDVALPNTTYQHGVRYAVPEVHVRTLPCTDEWMSLSNLADNQWIPGKLKLWVSGGCKMESSSENRAHSGRTEKTSGAGLIRGAIG